MSDIVIVGGSIEGLILSILCAKKHNVTVIDIHPEIGFPCVIPGWVENRESLQKYLEVDEINHLKILQNPNGLALRGEWLFKILAIKAAQLGVQLLLRCRVTKVELSSLQTTISTTGGNNNGTGTIICDKMFDLTEYTAKAPGKLQHSMPEVQDQKNPKQSFHHWGGLALSQEQHNSTVEPILQLIREDGLCEFWYDEKPSWSPKNGWIETMQNTIPKALKDMSIDNSITYAESLFESLNH
tara:strand:- start:65 stop:787 length:723 start_codon:yes stop_codon:yes gene_type:complete